MKKRPKRASRRKSTAGAAKNQPKVQVQSLDWPAASPPPLAAGERPLIQILEQKLSYHFSQPALLWQALRHRSLPMPNNERLEFLGDAVLNLVAADQLYLARPQAREGELSRCRTSLVSGESLAVLAEHFGIEQWLQFAPSDLQRTELLTRHRALLADAMEAIIGAVYLDSSWLIVRELVVSWLHTATQKQPELNVKDAKTRLQEWLQDQHYPLPEYQVIGSTGLEHLKVFTVSCQVAALKTVFKGQGANKRAAEQAAAGQALAALEALASGERASAVKLAKKVRNGGLKLANKWPNQLAK